MRILYVYPGPVPPARDPELDKMHYIPDPVCGDVLLPVWFNSAEEVESHLGPGTYPRHAVGNFEYHFFLAGRHCATPQGKLAIFWFFLRHGLALARQHRFDCVMTYGWTLTGVAAFLIQRLAGIPRLIIEVGTAPHNYNRFGRFGLSKQTIGTRLAKSASDFLLNFIGSRCDRLQLRYPWQLEHYPRLREKPVSIIHGFIPVSRVPFTGVNDGSILMVGAPWYLKGADLLIRGFQMIADEFPEAKLNLLGHFPDPQDLERMINGHPRIQLLAARSNTETVQVIASCSIFALASRTEAGGRVLLEAMAAGKPLLGSSADGNPYYVQDEVNGLVFESENAADAAAKMRRLLASPELRARFGAKGREFAMQRYSERAFGEQFKEMALLTQHGSAEVQAVIAVPGRK